MAHHRHPEESLLSGTRPRPAAGPPGPARSWRTIVELHHSKHLDQRLRRLILARIKPTRSREGWLGQHGRPVGTHRNPTPDEKRTGYDRGGSAKPAPGGKRTGYDRRGPAKPSSGWKTYGQDPRMPAKPPLRMENGRPIAHETSRGWKSHQWSSGGPQHSTPAGERTSAEHGARQKLDSGRKTDRSRARRASGTQLRSENVRGTTGEGPRNPTPGGKRTPRHSTGTAGAQLRLENAHGPGPVPGTRTEGQ